ncbi:glycosyltransferase [Gemmatirosa kalamazoonensis]|uniref:Glycosyltransferase n=2 Tax=Gemmatirosa kalamazoonensis TaxID=861299 RepID=W0RQH6_9BACT|nr:glycosyltransferase [Gemmatirosa kalamazoonensis]
MHFGWALCRVSARGGVPDTESVVMIRTDRSDRATRVVPTFDAPLIVHSHLRWDFVWQRPQQLLSRFAESVPVLFVEEPLFADDLSHARLDLSTPAPNVTRAVPVLPATLRDHGDRALAEVRTLLLAALARGGALGGRFTAPVQWFYTPMPAPTMIGAFGERGIVYDCMDELSKFRFAPRELVDRERMLMARADVVFTGGHKLWLSKSKRHPNVHFFGCGVDSAHFAKARRSDLPRPTDLADVDAPILGYYGVIDERIDYDLVRGLAEAHPDCVVAMVGPVVKVDPRELPQAPNIRWLGQKPYAELPMYAKAFDVCLMPFALNEATEYINPTKTLEYMAAGKPIVSTPIADVLHHFTPVVSVADTVQDFAAAVRVALTAPDPELIARGIGMAKEHTWDSIVARMCAIIVDALDATDLVDAHLAPFAAGATKPAAAPARRAVPPLLEAVGGEGMTA